VLHFSGGGGLGRTFPGSSSALASTRKIEKPFRCPDLGGVPSYQCAPVPRMCTLYSISFFDHLVLSLSSFLKDYLLIAVTISYHISVLILHHKVTRINLLEYMTAHAHYIFIIDLYCIQYLRAKRKCPQKALGCRIKTIIKKYINHFQNLAICQESFYRRFGNRC
jgi:hypothetical protein